MTLTPLTNSNSFETQYNQLEGTKDNEIKPLRRSARLQEKLFAAKTSEPTSSSKKRIFTEISSNKRGSKELAPSRKKPANIELSSGEEISENDSQTPAAKKTDLYYRKQMFASNCQESSHSDCEHTYNEREFTPYVPISDSDSDSDSYNNHGIYPHCRCVNDSDSDDDYSHLPPGFFID